MIFSKKTYGVFVVTLVLFIFISYFYIDILLARYFLTHSQTYENIGNFISIFGESHWYFATAIIGFLFFKYFKLNELYKNRFLFLLYINLLSGLMSLFLKWIFGRMRPWGLRNNGDEFEFLAFSNFNLGFFDKIKLHYTTLLDSPTTFTSFPSGHTTTIFAAFTYLVLLFPKYIYLWLSVAIVFSSGRILANDHFISDIFAGVMVGTLSTMFLYSKLNRVLGLNFK